MNRMKASGWKAFRNGMGFLGLISLGLSVWLQGVAHPAMAGASVELNGYQITFLGVIEHPDQTSTWQYEVRPVSASKDLSHWVLALCMGSQVLSSAPPGEVGLDPTTGLWGIKWDQPLGTTDEPRLYAVTLNGWFEVGITQVAVKAGRDPVQGEIDGPSCTLRTPTTTPTPTAPVPTSTPTPLVEPPTPTPTPQAEPPTPTPTATPTPPVEPPTPTPTAPAPTPTPPVEPPTPTPPMEPPTPTPTTIAHPPVPTPTPVGNPPPAASPAPTIPPASDLLPVTGVASRGLSGWSLLFARLSGLFLGLALAAHVGLTWRAHSQ